MLGEGDVGVRDGGEGESEGGGIEYAGKDHSVVEGDGNVVHAVAVVGAGAWVTIG